MPTRPLTSAVAEVPPSARADNARGRLVLVWRITTRCHLGCHFCAYDVNLEGPRFTVDADPVLRLGEVLAAWSAASGRGVLISWLGGEPLLWPHLETVTPRLARLPGVRVGLTTNGALLAQPRRQQWAVDYLAELTVSVDGTAAFHDWARGEAGLHAQVLGALHAVADLRVQQGRGPLLRVNTILMRGNLDAFEALCQQLVDHGVEELTFNPLGGNDRPYFFPANRLTPEQVETFAEALPTLQARFAAKGLRIRGSPAYLERMRCTARGTALPIDDCHPGRSFGFIDEQGRIAPCSFTAAGYGIPVAELKGPADLDGLPARFASARGRFRLAPCHDCHSTQVFEKFHEPRGSR